MDTSNMSGIVNYDETVACGYVGWPFDVRKLKIALDF